MGRETADEKSNYLFAFSRLPSHVSRPPFHVSRLPFHVSRLPFHDSKEI